MMKTAVGAAGYPKVKLCKAGTEKHFHIHDLLWKAFGSGKHQLVRHLDGNPLNNCINNLKGGTHQETPTTPYVMARVPEKINTCKLTPALVLEIRAAHAAGEGGHRRLARRYGVTRNNIKCIVDRTTWRHL